MGEIINMILLLFLDSTNSTTKDQNVGMPQSYQSDRRSRNHFLMEGIMIECSVDSLVKCMNKCNELIPKCKAFSYSQKSKKCILNNIKREDAVKAAYVFNHGFVYYEAM